MLSRCLLLSNSLPPQGWDVPERDSAAAAHPAPAVPRARGSTAAAASAARLPEIALKSRDERERAELELLGRARRIGDALEDAFCSEGRASRKPVRLETLGSQGRDSASERRLAPNTAGADAGTERSR